MKNKALSIYAVAAALGLLALGSLMDGPSEAEVAQAMADDHKDAQLAAQRFQRDLVACRKAHGPDADLIQIESSGNYVCRTVAVEPTPAEILHRYADLAGRKQ